MKSGGSLTVATTDADAPSVPAVLTGTKIYSNSPPTDSKTVVKVPSF